MLVIGHRGAKGLAPENTLQGLEKALEHHVDAIEIDIRVTKDGVPVLLHDEQASDAAGNKLRVSECSQAELKAHKPEMPTLTEAIELVNRRVPLVIELKPKEPTEPVIKVIREFLGRGWQAEDLAFISFDFKILKALRREFPHHLLIVDELWSGVRASSRAHRLGSRDISIWAPVLWPGFIRAVSRNYRLYAFPQNSPKRASRWAKAGLHASITDYPDLFEK